MPLSRRRLLHLAAKTGLAGATAPLWSSLLSEQAFAQASGSYKALVVATLPGGNDGNNVLVPMDSSSFAEYTSLRSYLALSPGSLRPITSNGAPFGLHSSLTNVAALYNARRAALVANVGPLRRPATKAQILADRTLLPASLLAHPQGRAQWESASADDIPATGWGGRIADVVASLSGSLPPLLDVAGASTFTVGRSVQAIAVQSTTGSFVPLPTGIDSAILAIAQADGASSNRLVAEAGALRVAASKQQIIIANAKAAGSTLQTQFPATAFGGQLKTIAQVIAGRSVIGASRQIFYCQQGNYDTHQDQLTSHTNLLAELDGGIGAFMAAMGERGLGNEVLLCTHSDFNRSLQANSTGGTDHAWGNHQIVVGGGIQGGQIFGSMPALELGGSSDLGTQGLWIPTLSVTQMTAGIGAWMGLSGSQLTGVFPDLGNFPAGALRFV